MEYYVGEHFFSEILWAMCSNTAEMVQGMEEFSTNVTFSLWVLGHNLSDDHGLVIGFTSIGRYEC